MGEVEPRVDALEFALMFYGPMIVVAVLAVLLTWLSYRKRQQFGQSTGDPVDSEKHHDIAEYEARSRSGMH